MEHASPRIHAPDKDLVPRTMVRLMAGLVLTCLVMVSIFVWSGSAKDAMPPVSPIKAERVVTLTGQMSGAAQVHDIDGTLIADLSPEKGGFISGMWRVLQRERTKARVALDGPVRITAYENGRMAITDPSTGWRADLMGFGQDNAAAFARLLLN